MYIVHIPKLVPFGPAVLEKSSGQTNKHTNRQAVKQYLTKKMFHAVKKKSLMTRTNCMLIDYIKIIIMKDVHCMKRKRENVLK